MQKQGVLWKAASKAVMSAKTARKYLRAMKLPSQMKVTHTWRTRPDPFVEVWEEVKQELKADETLEAKTLFEDLQRRYPGRFQDSQLRTLQRRLKVWRATEGRGKEVFFAQQHYPGQLAQSDFTALTKVGVTLGGAPFPHLLYHFVLTYSNWETGTICYSESYESLSTGLQNALWELGGVPEEHQTDQLSSAVQPLKPDEKEEFTQRYRGLLAHYGLKGRKIQVGKANENGDVEQSHNRFKKAVDQALRMRGSRDFAERGEYEVFVRGLFARLNTGRRQRFEEELKVLRPLPQTRVDDCRRIRVKVGSGSTINLLRNVYSVHSRLIGEWVEARLTIDTVEIWYGQRRIETLPRLRGQRKHRIDYRHIIEWLVRKPGAFENYRYQADLFPTSRFRMVYDELKSHWPSRANREYLQILELAAQEGESLVDDTLRVLGAKEEPISAEVVAASIEAREKIPPATAIEIDAVDLTSYDNLLVEVELCINNSEELEVGVRL